MGPIMVVMENGDAGFVESSKELITKAKEIAKALGTSSVAVGFGSEAQKNLKGLAVDRVIAISNPELTQYHPEAYEKALTQVVEKDQPFLTLVANTTMGMDLGAGLAARASLPLIAYCSQLSVEGQEVLATSSVFAGKLMAEIVVPESGAVISVMPGQWPQDTDRGDPSIDQMSLDLPSSMKILQLIEPEKGDVDITKAEILVSVGRGIDNPDNLPLAEELAEAIGGVLSCSRPVVDAGWLPKSRQVGKSGQTVKPKVYMAFGISGAPEHQQGMKDADLIIAVNTDENASMMDIAHYGSTVDMLDLMPALTERLRGE